MKKPTISLPINDPNSFNNLEDQMFIELLSSNLNTPTKQKAFKDKWVKTILEKGVITK